MPISAKSVALHQATHKRIQVWWEPEDYATMVSNAKDCGLSASEYIRRAALDKKIVPRTDTDTLAQLMKLGGMQKKMIADLRVSLAENADVSTLIAATNKVYEDIICAIKSISGESK
jgi:hypothetical protein